MQYLTRAVDGGAVSFDQSWALLEKDAAGILRYNPKSPWERVALEGREFFQQDPITSQLT
jgi:hypothetical protein